MANVFFSYSHKDIKIRDEIDKHFSVLKRNKLIQTWYDREIRVGNEFDVEIKQELESADIILLLVSSDFLASEYCQEIEVKRALQKHRAREAKVVPIIVDICDWKHTELGKLKALPNDGRPIKKYGNRREAYQDVTNEIRKVANRLHHPSYAVAQELFSAIQPVKKKKARRNKFLSKSIRFAKKNPKLIIVLVILVYVYFKASEAPPAEELIDYGMTSIPPWEQPEK